MQRLQVFKKTRLRLKCTWAKSCGLTLTNTDRQPSSKVSSSGLKCFPDSAWQPLVFFGSFLNSVWQMRDAMTSVWLRGLLRPIYQDGWMQGQGGDHWLFSPQCFHNRISLKDSIGARLQRWWKSLMLFWYLANEKNCHFWSILINVHFVSCVLKNLIWVLAFDATWLWLSFSASNGSQSWEETLQLLNLTAADNFLVWSILIAWLFCMSPVSPVSPVIAFLIIWLWSWYWCSLALDFICRKQFGTIAITVALLDSLKIMKTAWLQFCFDMKVGFFMFRKELSRNRQRETLFTWWQGVTSCG